MSGLGSGPLSAALALGRSDLWGCGGEQAALGGFIRRSDRDRAVTRGRVTTPRAVPKPPHPRRDPDSVVLCVLATDEEDEGDIALQIHFTLIQAFCCDNDIHILRVSGMQRLADILGEPAPGSEPRDLHCLLVTVSGTGQGGRQGRGGFGDARVAECRGAGGADPALLSPQNPHTDAWKSQGLAEVANYCAESRDRNQWVPYVCLQER